MSTSPAKFSDLAAIIACTVMGVTACAERGDAPGVPRSGSSHGVVGAAPEPCEPPPPGTPDTVMLYVPLADLPPPSPEHGLAAARDWYYAEWPILFKGMEYATFGTRLTTKPEGTRGQARPIFYCGEHDGVPVYAKPPLEPYPRFITVQVDSTQFMPYAEVSEVR